MTMIGNEDNNAVALYNIEYLQLSKLSKWAPTDCRVYEHELFYTSFGVEKLALQSEIGKPVLRVHCQYKKTNFCLQTLLHTLDSSR